MSRKYATRAGVNLTAKERRETKDNVQQSTSNIQKSTRIQAPKDNSRVAHSVGRGLAVRTWSLDLLWMLDVGSWMLSFPGRQSAAFRLQKPSARGRNPMPFACIDGPCSLKAALLSRRSLVTRFLSWHRCQT